MEKNILKYSKINKYFDKNIINNKKKRDLLVSFEEILKIKKNIRQIFKTDNPSDIKKIIGENINNKIVSEKDYEYALLINNTYNDLYKKCKNILNEE